MEGMKGGGRVAVAVAVAEDNDMADGMQCSDHPFRTNPGGICAFCLQEKLGKLVSSSFPLPIRAPSSSSSSPSFRSDAAPSSSASLAAAPTSATSHYHHYYGRRTRLPFLLAKKNKKSKPSSASASGPDITLKRSKSTATPRTNHNPIPIQDFSPRKRNGFWSFLYLSSKSSKKLNSPPPSASASASAKLKDKCCSGSSLKNDIVLQQDNDTNNTTASSFDRKVSRSRSVGCGSRSFSGDFFERISTGFGDCTLRRVESQREGKPKAVADHHHHHHCMKERVRCGGLFSGFMLTSSSSSSSSSSYWVSSSADDAVNGKSATVALSHSRGRSWGWAFASPMRAFSGKPSSKETNRRDIIRDANDNKNNAAPNLSAIPSLLAVRG